MRDMLIRILNSIGLYTASQQRYHLAMEEYANHLEQAINKSSDPTKPIIVVADHTRIENVTLQHGQSLIVAPSAQYTSLIGVHVLHPTDDSKITQ